MRLKFKFIYKFIKLKIQKKMNDRCCAKRHKKYRKMINRIEGPVYRKNSLIQSQCRTRFDDNMVGFDNIDLETNDNLYVEYDAKSVSYDDVFY